ncbi:MAG: aldehyde reductase [Spirochaetia bacterium]|nr:aldehyde reductase [Spirochaetia bacterium]
MEKVQVTVTGGSGYIASHSIIKLLEKKYSVAATIRNLNRESSLRKLLHKHAEFSDENLKFIQADLLSDNNWAEAVHGSKYVLHMASPFLSYLPKDPEQELIRPAREGTLRVLKSSLAGGVKRVVLTSSMAAISYGHLPPKNESLLDEDTWTDINGPDLTPYIVSKTMAEKAAWDFMENEVKETMELVAINPSAVLGPVLEKDFSPSAELVKKLMERAMPALPEMGFQICDVRDVAEAHISAMTEKAAAGKRIAVTDRFLWFKEIAEILHNEYADQGYKIPQKTLPHFAVRLFSLLDKETRSVLNELGVHRKLSNNRLKSLLGIDPVSAKQSILETAKTLIEQGIIKSR